jgi:hypothetical protein
MRLGVQSRSAAARHFFLQPRCAVVMAEARSRDRRARSPKRPSPNPLFRWACRRATCQNVPLGAQPLRSTPNLEFNRAKKTIAGAGAGVKKSHEQELRAKQEQIPLHDFSRRGIAYRKENAKAEVMRVIWSSPVDWSVAGAEALVGVRPSRRYHRPLAVVHRTLQCRLEMPRVAILI